MQTDGKKIFLIDIDGTICEPVPNEGGLRKMRNAKPYTESIRRVNQLYEDGHYICFFTARTHAHRAVTEQWLRGHKVKYHKIIFNKPRKTPEFKEYHFVDDTRVRATTFKGKFTKFVRKKAEVEVFSD